MPEHGADAHGAVAQIEVERWRAGALVHAVDQVAEEVPVALVYEDVPHGVMLATPADLEDFGVGFTLSEGLVERPEEIRAVAVSSAGGSIEVRLSVAWECFAALLERRRRLTGRTGCGLCGVETAEQAVRTLAPLTGGPTVSVRELHAAIVTLGQRQPLNALTGSVHAAAWVRPTEGIETVREDVGRHNALDKLIGAQVRAGADLAGGFVLLTSRASFEMVQKCAAVGIRFVAALSAPTALAVRVARQTGVTLVAFAREQQHVVYAHAHRLRKD
jgi:FdhD protein